MAKCRKTLCNQSAVLQFKGSDGSIPCLKLDEPSQTVATDTIELCEIVIGLGLDGQSYRPGMQPCNWNRLLFVMGKWQKVYFTTDKVLTRSAVNTVSYKLHD